VSNVTNDSFISSFAQSDFLELFPAVGDDDISICCQSLQFIFNFMSVHCSLKAIIGSISVTVTIDPAPLNEAVPFLLNGPQTTLFIQYEVLSVAR
jgi:hypothetical protein